MKLSTSLALGLTVAAVAGCGPSDRTDPTDNETPMRVVDENVSWRVTVKTVLAAARLGDVGLMVDGRASEFVETVAADGPAPDSPEAAHDQAAEAAEDRRAGAAEVTWEAPRALLGPTNVQAIDLGSGELLQEITVPWTYCTGRRAAAARSPLASAWFETYLEFYGVVDGLEMWTFQGGGAGCEFVDPADNYWSVE
jgi:hypothetical protein